MERFKRIDLFVSSTFLDTKRQRTYLVTRVFPFVNEWCLKHNIVFNPIDLRWGITNEESEKGQTVKLCLKRVSESNPILLSFLGDRYGWIPSRNDLKDLEGVELGKSITELEIIEGLFGKVFHGNIKDAIFCFYHDKNYIDNSDEFKKLKKLKEFIIDNNYDVINYDIFEDGFYVNTKTLDKVLIDRIIEIIKKRLNIENTPKKTNFQEIELIKNSYRVELKRIDEFIDNKFKSSEKVERLVYKESFGLTSALSRRIINNYNPNILYRFSFVDDSLVDIDNLIYSLILELIEKENLGNNEWVKYLNKNDVLNNYLLLEEIFKGIPGKYILVIDGLLEDQNPLICYEWFNRLSRLEIKKLIITNKVYEIENQEFVLNIEEKESIITYKLKEIGKSIDKKLMEDLIIKQPDINKLVKYLTYLSNYSDHNNFIKDFDKINMIGIIEAHSQSLVLNSEDNSFSLDISLIHIFLTGNRYGLTIDDCIFLIKAFYISFSKERNEEKIRDNVYIYLANMKDYFYKNNELYVTRYFVPSEKRSLSCYLALVLNKLDLFNCDSHYFKNFIENLLDNDFVEDIESIIRMSLLDMNFIHSFINNCGISYVIKTYEKVILKTLSFNNDKFSEGNKLIKQKLFEILINNHPDDVFVIIYKYLLLIKQIDIDNQNILIKKLKSLSKLCPIIKMHKGHELFDEYEYSFKKGVTIINKLPEIEYNDHLVVLYNKIIYAIDKTKNIIYLINMYTGEILNFICFTKDKKLEGIIRKNNSFHIFFSNHPSYVFLPEHHISYFNMLRPDFSKNGIRRIINQQDYSNYIIIENNNNVRFGALGNNNVYVNPYFLKFKDELLDIFIFNDNDKMIQFVFIKNKGLFKYSQDEFELILDWENEGLNKRSVCSDKNYIYYLSNNNYLFKFNPLTNEKISIQMKANEVFHLINDWFIFLRDDCLYVNNVKIEENVHSIETIISRRQDWVVIVNKNDMLLLKLDDIPALRF